MQLSEIRKRYLDFFKARGHVIIPSAPLVPENDPTTLFTGSGMQPMVPYLLGQSHPEGTRITDSQKSFRSGDIEEVGDNRHTTFFEMLGNWSLGDYFKQEQLPWMFEFLTDAEKGLGMDPHRLYVTAFLGDDKNNLPRDTESVEIWKRLFKEKDIDADVALIGSEADGYERGIKLGERIFYYDSKKNWWSRAGVPENMPVGEPGGPDSEMFYDIGTDHNQKFGKHCHPNCDCGRFIEVGNNVFMEYLKKPDGSFGSLPKKNVDFGGGLERIAMAVANVPDIIEVCHRPILDALEKMSGKKYGGGVVASEDDLSFRIIADHVKAASFLIADGVLPSNVERGYFVRRLLRRAIRHIHKLGIRGGLNREKFSEKLSALVDPALEQYKEVYPETFASREHVKKVIDDEAVKFSQTLKSALWAFDRAFGGGENLEKPLGPEDIGMPKAIIGHLSKKAALANENLGELLFYFNQSFGFPLELSLEKIHEYNISLTKEDIEMVRRDYQKAADEHANKSRTASGGMFKGGLADTSEKTVKLHTTHHLLLKALQTVLGPEVKQRGSNITSERLRLDFSYDRKMTDAEKQEVEKIVNEKIAEDLPVIRSEMAREDAEKLGAQHEFGQKYPERVSVYSIGPKSATLADPQFDQAFSIEFCGGPHVEHTGQIGHFKLAKEEAVAAGIRRVRGVID